MVLRKAPFGKRAGCRREGGGENVRRGSAKAVSTLTFQFDGSGVFTATPLQRPKLNPALVFGENLRTLVE